MRRREPGGPRRRPVRSPVLRIMVLVAGALILSGVSWVAGTVAAVALAAGVEAVAVPVAVGGLVVLQPAERGQDGVWRTWSGPQSCGTCTTPTDTAFINSGFVLGLYQDANHVNWVGCWGAALARMDEILALCRPRGIAVIEDACHALGGTYPLNETVPVGSYKGSAAAVFSLGWVLTGRGSFSRCCESITRSCWKFLSEA